MSNSYLDPSQFDGTPKAHPAWFRGRDAGIKEMLNIVSAIIGGADDGSGVCNAQPIEEVRRTLLEWRSRPLKSIVKLEQVIKEAEKEEPKKEEPKKEETKKEEVKKEEKKK